MRESLTCIVIDDDPLFVRKMETLIYSIEWLDLRAAYTAPIKGASGILRIKPEIVFLDLQMPHMDGYQLIDWLYPMFQIKGIRPLIVAISGNELENHPMLDQFLCYIPKSRLESHEVLSDEISRHLGPISA